MEIRKWEGKWTQQDCENHSEDLFVFSDNEHRQGCSGQAIIRSCDNATGICTAKRPTNFAAAHWTDKTFYRNKRRIDEDIKRILLIAGAKKAKNANFIVWIPEEGFGVASNLQKTAPKTYEYILEKIEELKKKKEEEANDEDS